MKTLRFRSNLRGKPSRPGQNPSKTAGIFFRRGAPRKILAESPYPRPRSGQNPCPKPSPTSGNLSKTLPPAHVTVTASGVRRNGLPLEPVTYDLHSAKTTYLTGYFRTRRLTRRPTSARGRAGPAAPLRGARARPGNRRRRRRGCRGPARSPAPRRHCFSSRGVAKQ